MSEQPRAEDRQTISPASWLIPPLIHVGMLVLLIGRLIQAGPSYQRIFDNFKMLLPVLTEWVLAVSRWLANYWYAVAMMLPVLYLIDAVITLLLGGWSRRAGWMWFLLVIVFMLGLWALCEYSWFLPMWKLYEGLRR